MFFGDHERIVLPASGLTVQVSTLPWHPDDPRDHRPFLAPDIYTPLTSADYRAGVDPAMGAILSRGAGPRLAERVEAAIAGGDSAAALRVVEEASRDVANRFRSPEADVNALGYRLLRAGRVPEAIEVFRVNTLAFPESANVWDSLGEALLAAGRRDEAIAAYRRALAIDPEFASATQALERLGAQ
jgi:tetratricopeptide (TPR) repeat protein